MSKSHYRQYIRYRGSKLILSTSLYEAEGLFMTSTNGSMKSTSVAINPILRATLNTVENFAAHNVSLPADAVFPSQTGSLYKPLWPSEWMKISISNWCNFLRLNYETGMYESVAPDSVFAKGLYQISIEIPYIYIGPHKEGQSFSLTLRVVQVLYQPYRPEESIVSSSNTLSNNIQVPITPSPNTDPKQKQKQTSTAPSTKTLEADGARVIAHQTTTTIISDSNIVEPKCPPTEGKKKRGRKNGAASIPLEEFK